MRTFTPGIVGTISYTAPEVLGVLEDQQQQQQQQQQPSVEEVLKVGPAWCVLQWGCRKSCVHST